MMSNMRALTPVIMWVVIVTFIGTIFFAWGMDFTSRKREPYVAKVGKDLISIRNFERMLTAERENMRQSYPNGEIPAEQNRMLPRQVFESELTRILLQRVFSEMKLSASAEEIYQYIKNNPPPEIQRHPAFQTDSVFDTTKYIQFLNSPEDVQQIASLEEYAKKIVLPMFKLRVLVEGGVLPSRAEVAYEFRCRNERAVFEYCRVDASTFAVQPSEITDAQLQSYYQSHNSTFMSDVRAQLQFVKISKLPTAQDDSTYYNELLDIKKRVESGTAEFAEEARLLSDDEGSAKNGGELGWFASGAMVPAFEQVAFTLQPGQVSDPVKTAFGYHIIKVFERKTEGGKLMVNASHILRKIIPTMETLDSLEWLADSLRRRLDTGDFVTVAQSQGFSVDSTSLFTKGEIVPEVGYLNGLMNFAFSQDVGSYSEPLEDDNAFFIFKIVRRTKKGIMGFSDVHQQIVASVSDSLRSEKARKFISDLAVKAAQNGGSLAGLSDAASGVFAGVSDTVTRRQYVSNIGMDNQPLAAAFGIPLNSISKVIPSKNYFYLVKTLWRSPVDTLPMNSPDMQQISREYANTERQKAYIQWYTDYKKQSGVIDKLNEYYMD
jgi:hypothetical protein